MAHTRPSLLNKASVLGALLLLVPALNIAAGLTNRAAAATPSPIDLGTTRAASVLGGTGVTNTGPSVLNLDLDSSPTPAITGFPPGIVNGARHAADVVAQRAQSDLTIAYNAAASAPSTNNVTGIDLGGKTLTQGVYTASSGLAMNGPLALTLNGTAASVFVFQAGSTLVTGSNSSVVLTGGVLACNVFWQVGSSATIGTNTAFVGNILAHTSIALNTGAKVAGRALARIGSVTLDSNVFTTSTCGTTPATPATSKGTITTFAGTGGAAPLSSPGGSAPRAPSVVGPPRTGGAPLAGTSSAWPSLWLLLLSFSAAVALAVTYWARRHSMPEAL